MIIGGLIFLIGPAVTGEIFTTMLRVFMQDAPPSVGLSGADVDSEMRFYAVLWMAGSGVALWVSRAIQERMRLLRWMLVIFWLGGIGRVISYFANGAPHPPIHLVLMWVEVVLPIVLLALTYPGAKAASG
ncbi:MAG: DUF4345 domain-containing protein [Caulobacteraceae bacterium]|nr:DUF4345 domain-containing protein [Caulobacteraceae bacterium]